MATSLTTTHATSGGCSVSVETQEKPRTFPKRIFAVNCNIQIPVTTNTAAYLHANKHVHTHKHLSLPIRESECSNLQKVLTQYGSDLVDICCQTKSSKLKLSSSETGMNVAHLLNVAMSGRFSVSTLCSYCPHCGLALTKEGGYRSAKNSPQREAPAEENKESGGFLVCWIMYWFNLLKPIWLHI